MRFLYILFFFSYFIYSQNIDVNNDFNYSLLRNAILKGDISTNYSLNIKPVDLQKFESLFNKQYKTIIENSSKSIQIKTLGIDYFLEYNSKHPYNRNNGSMIPNRGYQHIFSPGLFIKLGPISLKSS